MAKKLLTDEATAVAAANKVPKTGVNGRLDMSLIASGTPSNTQYVRSDGVLAVPPGSAAINVGSFGTLGTSNDSAVIQAALDSAEALGGATVVMPYDFGTYTAANLLIPSHTVFDLNGCTIQSVVGATGFLVGNKSVNSYRYHIRNGHLSCRGYNVVGVLLNHDGGTFGVDAADPEPRLTDLLVTNSATDSFRFIGTRVIQAVRLRSRASTGHGFTLLPGAGGTSDPDQTNDSIFLGCSASSASGDALHIETSSNQFKGFKCGEAHTGRGIYMGPFCQNSHIEGIVDNSLRNVYLDGASRNVLIIGTQQGFAANPAVELTNSARANIITGFAWATSNVTYAVKVATGCIENDICMVASGMVTGLVDPASDVVNNRVYVNGKEDGEQISRTLSLAAGVSATNATLLNTALSFDVVAGKTYEFRATLHMVPDATGGHKYAIGGTCTATAIVYEIVSQQQSPSIATVITSQQTAMAGTAGQNGATIARTIIEGVITVANAGTLVVQFAQNGSSGSTLMRRGSSFTLKKARAV